MGSAAGWLDTNVILRYLLNDHPDQGPRARALIERAERGECKLKIASHIVCEAIYILENQDYARDEIYDALKDFSRISGIAFLDEDAIFEALVDYKDKNIDFADALLAALSRAKAETVWTFNRKHFARMTGSWEEPGAKRD